MPRRTALIVLACMALLSVVATLAVLSTIETAAIEPALVHLATWVEINPWTAAGLFLTWAIAANLIVIPSGSLTLVVAGFFAGAWIPALLWWGAQVVTAPIVHAIGGRCIDPETVERWLGHALPRSSIDTLRIAARRESLLASTLLRLTPLLPGAPGAVIAAAVGIPRHTFTAGTLAVGWIRPLYFASLGAALPALQDPSDLLTIKTLLPLGLIFVLSALALGLRVWLDRRQRALV